MSNVVPLHPPAPEVIDLAYMSARPDYFLAYTAWNDAASALQIALGEDFCADAVNDLRCELGRAVLALQVLSFRLTGTEPEKMRQAILEKGLEQAREGDQ